MTRVGWYGTPSELRHVEPLLPELATLEPGRVCIAVRERGGATEEAHDTSGADLDVLRERFPAIAFVDCDAEQVEVVLRGVDLTIVSHLGGVETAIEDGIHRALEAAGRGSIPLMSRSLALAELADEIGLPELLFDSADALLDAVARLDDADLRARVRAILRDELEARYGARAARKHLLGLIAFLDREPDSAAASGPAERAAHRGPDRLEVPARHVDARRPIAFHQPILEARELASVAAGARHHTPPGAEAVAALEHRAAAALGCDALVACASPRAALAIVLHAHEIGRGQRVLVSGLAPPWVALGVREAGADPFFVDVRPDTLGLDAERAEALVDRATAAIVFGHPHGFPLDRTPYERLAERFGLLLIEEASDAAGARWCGRPIGTRGLAIFAEDWLAGSWNGSPGFVATRDSWTHRLLARTRDDEPTGLCGAIRGFDLEVASACTARAGRIQSEDQRVARAYDAFGLSPLRALGPTARAEPSARRYVIRVPDRDHVARALGEADICVGRPGAIALTHPALRAEPRGDLRFTEDAQRELLCLPVHAELRRDDLYRVAETLQRILASER